MLVNKQRIDEHLADIDHMMAQLDGTHPAYNTLIHWKHPDFQPPPSHLHLENRAIRAKIRLLNRALLKHNAYVDKLEPRDDTPSWYLTITQEQNPTYIIHRGFIIAGSNLSTFIDTLITDCITQPIGEINMNIYKTDTFKYLEGIMVKNKPMTLTIKGATVEEISNGNNTEKKILVHFEETPKAAIMNKTNLKSIAAELGPETDNWIGRKVKVYAEKGRWFGKESWALRFSVAKQQPPTPVKPTPTTNGASAPTELASRGGSQTAQEMVAAAPDPATDPGSYTIEKANADFF
jgi:hypothetical protein